MKFKATIFFIVLYFLVNGTNAQPQFYGGFYPYQTCSFSPSADIILSGRIVSSEFVKKPNLRQIAIYKAEIEIEKVFKGSPKKTVEILWGEDGWFFDLKKGDERIFIINEVNLNNSKILLSRKWSRHQKTTERKRKPISFPSSNLGLNDTLSLRPL